MLRGLWLAARAIVVPSWAPHLVAVAAVVGLWTYAHHLGASRQHNADMVAISVERDKAQKHFAEQARANAAAVFALNAKHAAELIERNRRDDELTAAWQVEVAKTPSGSKAVCWSKAIVRELRK